MTTKAKAKAHFEIPKGNINFANLRTREDVYTQLYERYVPLVKLSSLTEAQKFSLGYEELPASVKTVPDPDVLWVGRFLDGLTAFGVFSDRQFAKNMINNIPAGRTFRTPGIAGRFTGGGTVQMWFKPVEPRIEMIKAASTGVLYNDSQIKDMIMEGKSPTISIGTIIKDAEPGEIRNSPEVIEASQSLEDEEVDMWEAGLTESQWNPRIRMDNRFGMHYLKRGDEITIVGEGFPRPGTPHFELKWRLKPISEGPSLIQQDSSDNDTIQLSSMRA